MDLLVGVKGHLVKDSTLRRRGTLKGRRRLRAFGRTLVVVRVRLISLKGKDLFSKDVILESNAKDQRTDRDLRLSGETSDFFCRVVTYPLGSRFPRLDFLTPERKELGASLNIQAHCKEQALSFSNTTRKDGTFGALLSKHT